MSKKEKQNSADILGEENRIPKLGDLLVFSISGGEDFTRYASFVSKVHHTGAVDIMILRESFTEFRTRIPIVAEETSGAAMWAT